MVIDVPLQQVPPELIDPHYDDRHTIAELMHRPDQIMPSYPIIKLGQLANKAAFSQELNLACLGAEENEFQLPIPFEVDYAKERARYLLPDALGQFAEAVIAIAAHEHSAYPLGRPEGSSTIKSEAYLTVDQTNVLAGRAQRPGNAGQRLAHRDGKRGQWAHIYVIRDSDPTTEFFPISDSSMYARRESRVYTPVRVTARMAAAADRAAPYQIGFANNTTLHRPSIFTESSRPTFLRMTYLHRTA